MIWETIFHWCQLFAAIAVCISGHENLVRARIFWALITNNSLFVQIAAFIQNIDRIDTVHAVILPITTGICHRLKYTVQSSPISINCIWVSAFTLLCSLLTLVSTAFVHFFSQLSRGIFTRNTILNSGETLLMKGNYYEWKSYPIFGVKYKKYFICSNL